MNTKIFYQAILLGIVTILLGLIFSVIFGSLKKELKEECELWDEYYVMEVVLFFTGVTIRLLLTSDMGNKYLLSA
jgi:hypothetical protein